MKIHIATLLLLAGMLFARVDGLCATGTAMQPSSSEVDFLIVPGESVGKIHLGMSKQEVLKLLGQPARHTKDDSFLYEAKRSGNSTEVFFSQGRVIQVNFTSKTYKTTNGINTHNFQDEKYKEVFAKWRLRWRFVNIKYTLKTGGLTFYNLNADSADPAYAVRFVGAVHKGVTPEYHVLSLEGEPDGGWKVWDGKDIYSE